MKYWRLYMGQVHKRVCLYSMYLLKLPSSMSVTVARQQCGALANQWEKREGLHRAAKKN